MARLLKHALRRRARVGGGVRGSTPSGTPESNMATVPRPPWRPLIISCRTSLAALPPTLSADRWPRQSSIPGHNRISESYTEVITRSMSGQSRHINDILDRLPVLRSWIERQYPPRGAETAGQRMRVKNQVIALRLPSPGVLPKWRDRRFVYNILTVGI